MGFTEVPGGYLLLTLVLTINHLFAFSPGKGPEDEGRKLVLCPTALLGDRSPFLQVWGCAGAGMPNGGRRWCCRKTFLQREPGACLLWIYHTLLHSGPVRLRTAHTLYKQGCTLKPSCQTCLCLQSSRIYFSGFIVLPFLRVQSKG